MVGMAARWIMDRLNIVHLLDGEAMTRLAALSMECLLFSTLTGILFSTVQTDWIPMHVLSVGLAVFTLFFMLADGQKKFGSSV